MQAMKGCKAGFVVFLTVALMLALPAAISSYSRDELSKYKEMELVAPDFSLRGLDGKTYKLSDYRGKKVVVLETGSST